MSNSDGYMRTSGVREVTENVAEVQARHGDFGYDHLEEGTKGGEHAELLLVETETSRCAEVSALHDCDI